MPPTSNQWLLFAYYSGLGILFYAAFTAVVLTHNALAAELTQGYDERIGLISFKAAFSIGASIFSLGLAQIIFARVHDPSQKYWILGTICAVVATLAVFYCVWGTYKRYQQIAAQREPLTQGSILPITQQFRIAFSNFPFICVIGIGSNCKAIRLKLRKRECSISLDRLESRFTAPSLFEITF